mmetsp:Transcript_7121/g.6315  ORF Transcript_7121/g.6315 Transcript_7121/m.6315 type:complete len:316 (+) Transcript_7121:3-950(+)
MIYQGEEFKDCKSLPGCDDILVINDPKHKTRYFLHKKKNILLREGLWLRILRDYNIPVYNLSKVHFKDVCKRLIKNATNNQGMDGILKRKLRKKWEGKYKAVSKKPHVGTLDMVIAGRIITKWTSYKRIITERSNRRSVVLGTRTQKKSKSSLPNINLIRKPPTPELSNNNDMESIAISDDEESLAKMSSLNMLNHFEEEEKAHDMKTIDPSNTIKPYQDSLDQELEFTSKFEEQKVIDKKLDGREEDLEAFTAQTKVNQNKYSKQTKPSSDKLSGKVLLFFYSSIEHKNLPKEKKEEKEDSIIEEAEEIGIYGD